MFLEVTIVLYMYNYLIRFENIEYSIDMDLVYMDNHSIQLDETIQLNLDEYHCKFDYY